LINIGVLQAVLRLKDTLTPAITKARQRVVAASAQMAKRIAIVGTAAVAAFGLFAASAANAASRAQETQNLFEVSFGDMADQAEAWAQRVNAAIGVNDTTLKEFSGTLFNMTSSMGVATDVAFDLSTSFTQIALDASSFFNLPFERSFQVIQAGLAGEVEGLRRLGVDVTEATIKQLDFVKAIEASGRELTQSEKIQARAVAIINGLQNAQGDLIETQNSWANQTRLVGEVWTDFLEVVGRFITDSNEVAAVLTGITLAIQMMTAWVQRNADAINSMISEGFVGILNAGPAVASAFAFISEQIGGAVFGLGVLTRGFGDLLVFLKESTPALSAIGFVFPEMTANMDRAAQKVQETGARLEELGKTAFDSGQDVRDFASNMQNSIDEIVERMSEQGDVTDETRQFVDDYVQQLEDLKKALEEATTGEVKLTKAQLQRQREQQALSQAQQILAQTSSDVVEPLEIQRKSWVDLGPLVRDYDFTMLQVSRTLFEYGNESNTAADQNRAFGQSLQEAADFARLFNNDLGSLIGQLGAFSGGLQSLFGEGGGIGSIFGEASEKAGGGILGAISGVASLAGPFGAIAGFGFELGGMLMNAFGRGADDVMDDVTRDIGASISEGLAEQILESGENAQLFLREIFEEGSLALDDFAREVGDLFSFFERGELSEEGLIRELEETLPILIENFQELGPAGEAQLQRIIGAADRFGIEIQELDQLMQKTFAPDTLETMAEKFGLSVQQAREMAKVLDLDVQTNLERTAASVGLTAEEFKRLGAALETQLNIPAGQLKEFLDSTGLSAQALAEKLGIDVGEGAQLAASAQEAANKNIQQGVDFAAQLRRELEGAAAASRNIQVPTGSGSPLPPGLQDGGLVRANPPFGTTVRLGEREDELVVPAGRAQRSSPGLSEEDFRALRRDLRSLPRLISRGVRDGLQQGRVD